MRSPTATTPRATGGRGVRYARRPRRTLFSHDSQRASRKLSVDAVALCALLPPTILVILSRRYAPAASVQSVVLPHAFGLPAIVAGWTWCATSAASAAATSTATTTMHSPAHRRLRQALRRRRRKSRPLFTRPAWPRQSCTSICTNAQIKEGTSLV